MEFGPVDNLTARFQLQILIVGAEWQQALHRLPVGIAHNDTKTERDVDVCLVVESVEDGLLQVEVLVGGRAAVGEIAQPVEKALKYGVNVLGVEAGCMPIMANWAPL